MSLKTLNEFAWVKRCAKRAREINAGPMFGRAYRLFREQGSTPVSASTRALFICTSVMRVRVPLPETRGRKG